MLKFSLARSPLRKRTGARINEAQGGRLQVDEINVGPSAKNRDTSGNAPTAAPPIGVAVGGSVSGSTINIGIPPGELEGLLRPYRELSEHKKLIAELEAKLDLNQRQVRTALEILGEKLIPPERLAAKLVEIAERFKASGSDGVGSAGGDDAKIAALKAGAQKAIEAGDLAKADALLADVESAILGRG